MRPYLSRFLYVLSGNRKKLVFLTGLAIFASVLEAFGIGMVGPFVAVITNPQFIERNPQIMSVLRGFGLNSINQVLLVLGGAVVLAFYIKSFLSFYVQKYIFQFGYDQRGKLFLRLMSAYLRAPYTYHSQHNSSELIQRMVNETDEFTRDALVPILFLGSNCFIVLAIVVLLIMTNILAVLVISGIFLTAFALFQPFKHYLELWGKDRSQSLEAMIRVINHALGGLKEVRVIGCEQYFETEAKQHTHRYAVSGASAMAFGNLPRYALEAFLMTFLVVFAFIYIKINQGNSESLSSVLGIFAIASVRMLPSLILVVQSLNALRYAAYALDKIYLDLWELEQIAPPPPLRAAQEQQRLAQRTLPFQSEVTLHQITYQYPQGTQPSLQDVSLSLRKGESIGIIGRSGAGKTTLIDVILGLLLPQSGDIQVDGQSVYQDLRAWQNLIGYVPQSIFLTDDSLERNIAFGVPDHLIDPERLRKAIAVAQLSELVDSLPEGAKTLVGERGTRLSGGQRQRIGIARVIYHNRPILVLDEATSALDNETEALVSESVKALGGEKTIIIIAHRLSTIAHCDRIYRMEQGRVVASGTYEEVVLHSSEATATHS
jgi:ABC-type multidrug transport system fused ATPase/permease subunit